MLYIFTEPHSQCTHLCTLLFFHVNQETPPLQRGDLCTMHNMIVPFHDLEGMNYYYQATMIDHKLAKL